MSDEGNGDGDFVTFGEFRLYQKSQHELCASYRGHIETKIDGMEKSIKWSVYLTGATISLLLGLVNWYLNVVLI